MKKLGLLLVCLLALASVSVSAGGKREEPAGRTAEAYPTQPLTIVEPWPAGSAGDAGARIIANEAEKYFGRPIVVQNVTGGGGAKAAREVAGARPDGYTILNSWVANHVMRPLFDADVGYARDDFLPIILYQINPFTLVVRSDHPADNLEEFVRWANSQDRVLNVGIAAAVGLPRLVMQRFLEVAEIDNYNPVAYQDAETENIKGLFDGSLDFTTGAIPVINMYGDRIKTLAILTEERSPLAPQVPTAKEQGYDLEWGAVAAGWSGLSAPKGVPEERMEKIRAAFMKAAQSEEFRKKMKEAGMTVQYMPPDEFRELWERSHELLGPQIEKLKK